jgi:G3E family GTPase
LNIRQFNSSHKKMQARKNLYNIPTTIVTGFLGAGKTTAINHLLAEKPAGELWAVLVNEFGQVGVDASLIGPVAGVSIKEIAGGCLCCTAGQAFEVALNRLIRDTAPDRILIEPTGIGHPLKIIRILSGGFYRDVLDLRATICLVDARKISDSRYREHPAFQDQLNLSDVLVASKADLYSDDDRSAFAALVSGSIPPKSTYAMISFGKVDCALLDLPRNQYRIAGFPDAHPVKELPFSLDGMQDIPDKKAAPVSRESWVMHEGSGEGYYRGSWLIGTRYRFDSNALSALITLFPYVRVKGIMQCHEGWLKINGSEGVVEYSAGEPQGYSRLEIIDSAPLACGRIEEGLRGIVGSRQ